MHILWLGQPGCDDRTVVGGKVAHLSRLAAAHRVPPGFCLTTAAYDLAMAAAGAAPAGPPALDEAVAAAYQELAERCGTADPAVAVRSSAVDEDGAAASFAGQYETYLNVAGHEAVREAVWRCWAAASSGRAAAYRRRQGLATDGSRLAVLVQQLIVADASAVVFSANPVSRRPDEIVINAGWALGESLVGGTVTPDTYRVRKADLAVVACEVAEKQRMTVAVAAGTREVDVPRLLRAQPAIDDEQVMALARLALTLETDLGRPVDVECAFRAGELYLLQCRPITTL